MVLKLYGAAQRDLARPCIQSLHMRMDYSRFHYSTSSDIVAEQVTQDSDENDVFMLILGANEKKSKPFRLARFKAEAHLIACLQSLHGIPDTLAHVVYYGLGLNLATTTALPEHDIAMGRVIDKLRATDDAGDLNVILLRMVRSADHSYLNALVNHCKHRSVVQASYGLSREAPEVVEHGLRFESFTYRGVTYPRRWVRDVLPPQHERLSQHMIEAGIELNRVLLKRIELLAA